MQPRPDHPGEPSVATALHWLFTHVLQQSASRQWRGANVLYWPRSDDVQPRVAHARDLGTRDYTDETHIALPFDMLRDLPAQIPQHCQLGALVILSLMLPQGSGISVPGSILQAAHQRFLKLSCPRIPPPVRLLMRNFSCIYVDDSLT